MPIFYEISGDEAWVHCNLPLNRYWCFFGGLFGETSAMDALETALKKCAITHNFVSEFKWTAIASGSLPAFKAIVDVVFDHLRTKEIRYRQIFLDRALVHSSSPGDPTLSDLDIQFRICYQFIKHAFGLKYLPCSADKDSRVTIRLDTHSSQKHKRRLVEEIMAVPQRLGRPDITVHLSHICSTKLRRIQACDILLGAAGSYGNKYDKRRHNGKKRMTETQRARLKLAKYIYDKFRSLDAEMRKSKAFNWFESTGTDGIIENRFLHKVRVWKFIPKRYQIDKGWRNSNLTKEGLYVAQDLDPEIRIA